MMMENKACLDNIAKKNPPVPCPADWCERFEREIREYCMHAAFPPNAPIPQIGPDGKKCWCCCGGFYADATAAAISGDAFLPLVELRPGDRVLATGADLANWAQAEVKAVGRLQAAGDDARAVQLHVALPDGGMVTLNLAAEALLLADDSRLHAVGRLVAGAKLRTVDGNLAEVKESRATRVDVTHIHLGRLDPAAPLDGHLFNLAGLVCADLAVGVAAFLGELPDDLIAPPRMH